MKQLLITKKLQRSLVEGRLTCSLNMKNIQEVLKESPVSSYTGSENTFDMVSKQIKEKYGLDELKNYDPFHNTRTFRSWLALGFRVRKGEKALRSITYTETKDTVGNVIKRVRHPVYLFYYRQVEPIKNK